MVAQVDLGNSVEEFLQTMGRVLPQVLVFLLILIVGYFVARAIGAIVDKVLERVGFNRAVERGGVGRVLAPTKYHPSDILGKLVFYALMLFVLQLAFGVFGPNPISELIAGVIAYLPNIFVAIVIIVIAAAIAAAVKDIVASSLGGLSYGRPLALAASAAILVIGVFAALDQLEIAPTIVNSLFIALLAVVAGSAIVAIGGGGIMPMRRYWERSLQRLEREVPRVRDEAGDIRARVQEQGQQAVPGTTAGSAGAGADAGTGTSGIGSAAGTADRPVAPPPSAGQGSSTGRTAPVAPGDDESLQRRSDATERLTTSDPAYREGAEAGYRDGSTAAPAHDHTQPLNAEELRSDLRDDDLRRDDSRRDPRR